jgi:hypothetical protein
MSARTLSQLHVDTNIELSDEPPSKRPRKVSLCLQITFKIQLSDLTFFFCSPHLQSDQIQTLLSLAASVAPDLHKQLNAVDGTVRSNALMIQATLVLAAFCLLDDPTQDSDASDSELSDGGDELLCAEELESDDDSESSLSLKLSPCSDTGCHSCSSTSSGQLNFSDLPTASADDTPHSEIDSTSEHDLDVDAEEEDDLRARPQTESPHHGPARRLAFLYCD